MFGLVDDLNKQILSGRDVDSFVFVPLHFNFKRKEKLRMCRYLCRKSSRSSDHWDTVGIWTTNHLIDKTPEQLFRRRIKYVVRIKSLKAGVTGKEYTDGCNDVQGPPRAHGQAPEG